MNKTGMIRSLVLAVTLAAVAGAAAAQDAPSDAQAREIMQSAEPLAEQGNANAQYNMGVLYDEGYGVERDYAKARAWYEKAAAQNYAKAEHNLGIMYQQGHGVTADANAAARWFKRAAEHGEPAAQNNLAVMYVRGQGMDTDLGKAAMWAARAAKAGNESAVANLPHIVAELPKARIDGDRVNVRAEPTTDAEVVRQADGDTEVVVLDQRNDWSQILFADDYVTGWVANFLLASADAAASQPADTTAATENEPTPAQQSQASTAAPEQAPPQAEDKPAAEPQPEQQQAPATPEKHIAGNVVNIRAKPSTSADVVFQAHRGDRVSVLDESHDWMYVRFDDGKTGWVAGFLLAN